MNCMHCGAEYWDGFWFQRPGQPDCAHVIDEPEKRKAEAAAKRKLRRSELKAERDAIESIQATMASRTLV